MSNIILPAEVLFVLANILLSLLLSIWEALSRFYS